jgi:site-specific DNA-adenine methylase
MNINNKSKEELIFLYQDLQCEKDSLIEEVKQTRQEIWKLHNVIARQAKTLSENGLEEYIL